MSIVEDAHSLIRFLGTYRQIPGDTQTGKYSFSADDLRRHLDWELERLNDAVDYLRVSDLSHLAYVKTEQAAHPYSFVSIELTIQGRAYVEEPGLEGVSSRSPASPARQVVREARPRVDVAILSIKEEEFRAVLDAFPEDVGLHVGPTSHRHYNLRSADAGGGAQYQVAIVRHGEQGTGEAQNVARDLLEELQPALILVVGIAGGVPSDDLTLGDVVLSLQISDYTLHLRKEGTETEYSTAGGPIAREISGSVVNLPAREADLGDWTSGLPPRPPVEPDEANLYGPEDWKKRVRDSVNRHFGRKPRTKPRFASGVLGSSDALIKDANVLIAWLKTSRNLLAVEMESAGVYRATRDRCPMVAIRGLSDVVGLKRDERWTQYACRSAAAFARAYLRTTPTPLCTNQHENGHSRPARTAEADPNAAASVGPSARPGAPSQELTKRLLAIAILLAGAAIGALLISRRLSNVRGPSTGAAPPPLLSTQDGSPTAGCSSTCKGWCDGQRCVTPVQLADGQFGAQGLTLLRGGELAWATKGIQEWPVIQAISIDGGTARRLAVGPGWPSIVAADNQSVYWVEPQSGAVATVRRDGHGQRTLWRGKGSPNGLALGDSLVCWTEQGTGTIACIPKRGGDRRVLADAQPSPLGVTVVGEHVIWANMGTSDIGYLDGAIKRVRLDGSMEAETLAARQAQASILAMAGERLLWVSVGPNSVRQLMSLALNKLPNSSPERIAWLGQTPVTSLATDSTRVYWTIQASRPGGLIQGLNFSDRTPFVIASDQDVPWGLQVDEKAIYWTTAGNGPNSPGALMRIERPPSFRDQPQPTTALGGQPERQTEQPEPLVMPSKGGIEAGRDVIVHGNVNITNIMPGRPSYADLHDDVAAAVISVSFKDKPKFPHWAAIRVSANKYDHPEVYLKLTANTEIEDRGTLQREHWPGGSVTMEADRFRGRVWEHTETSPGLRPGKPWVVVLYARQPVTIVEVTFEDRSAWRELTQDLQR